MKNTSGGAGSGGKHFNKNKHRPALVYRLAEELRNRHATIPEFFLAFVYSNTDNIQANLYYLDYMRLKEAAAKKPEPAPKYRAMSELSKPRLVLRIGFAGQKGVAGGCIASACITRECL